MSDFRLVKFLDAPVQLNISIKPRGVYDSGTLYSIGDSVSYNGTSYICVATTIGNDPTNLTYWQLLADIAPTFETVSKNLKGYSYVLNYSLGVLTSIVYNLGGGLLITKTLNYTSGTLTSIVLSGDVPGGIALTKTLNYTLGKLTGISYS